MKDSLTPRQASGGHQPTAYSKDSRQLSNWRASHQAHLSQPQGKPLPSEKLGTAHDFQVRGGLGQVAAILPSRPNSRHALPHPIASRSRLSLAVCHSEGSCTTRGNLASPTLHSPAHAPSTVTTPFNLLVIPAKAGIQSSILGHKNHEEPQKMSPNALAWDYSPPPAVLSGRG